MSKFAIVFLVISLTAPAYGESGGVRAAGHGTAKPAPKPAPKEPAPKGESQPKANDKRIDC